MTRELEVELHAHRRAWRRARESNGVARTASRGIAVQRPRDGFEQRRLAGAVRADDAGEARLERDDGVRVLAEILELKPVESHGVVVTRAPRYRLASSLRSSRPHAGSRGRA